jgi:DNA-nicking Smr family endonuclease
MDGGEEDESELELDGVGEDETVVRLPIEDALDLHAIHPRDIRTAVEGYLEACQERGFREVRIIHGRGTGTQRAIVRSLLESSAAVAAFWDAEPERGGWGATIVALKSAADCEPREPDEKP